jgi:hypothetical protein
MAMSQLRQLDHLASVRFASVYRRFEDVEEFLEELAQFRGSGEVGGALRAPGTSVRANRIPGGRGPPLRVTLPSDSTGTAIAQSASAANPFILPTVVDGGGLVIGYAERGER